MKKAVTILVSLLYLLGILQVSVSFHYCGKHFKYVTINKVEEKKSCCKGKMKMHGCCTDKEVVYDLDDERTSGKYLIAQKLCEPDNATPVDIIQALVFPPHAEVFKVSHSPPLIKPPKLNILYCTYLI